MKTYEYALRLTNLVMNDLEEIMDELEDSDNLTDFIHAVSVLMPNAIYHSLTSERIDNLSFTHLANRLCFQYSKLNDNE